MPRYYVLNPDHSVRPVDNTEEWFECFSSPDRVVAQTYILGVQISTVFIGLNHRFFGHGPPLLFETMIFGGPLDQSQWRYSSWDDAITGHAAAVRKVRETMPSASSAVDFPS